MSNIPGKYELLSDPEDRVFDEYQIAMGVSDANREALAMVRPSIEISESGGGYTFKTLSELKNTAISFTLGKEFAEQTWDGRTAATVFTIEGDKLVQVQKVGGNEAKIVREFSAGGLTETYSTQGTTSLRKYKRVG